MDKLKLIKAVVALLTFLLVFGVLMAATLIYKKINASSSAEAYSFSLAEPLGSRINSILEYNGYIYLVVKDGGEPDRIIVLDADSLQKSARITIN